MVVEKNNKVEDYKFKKGNLNFAVIGHVEWINFLKVDQLPKPGVISHSEKSLEYPAGGGSIIAKILSDLTLNQIHFFTSLGNDDYGDKCFKILSNMGIKLHVAWRDKPTRRGFSLIDSQGERAITVIGERLAPTHKDNLEWNILKKMDGIFITASDSEIFKMARSASILCTTPRVGLNTINNSNVLLVSVFLGVSSAGLFVVAEKLVRAPINLITNNLRPVFAKHYQQKQNVEKAFKYCLILALISFSILSVAYFIIDFLFIYFFDEEYYGALPIIKVLLIWIFFNFVQLPFQSYNLHFFDFF